MSMKSKFAEAALTLYTRPLASQVLLYDSVTGFVCLKGMEC